MQRNDCKLAQDLMPLRIEELLSEESKAFVDEHIAACPPCAQMYGYMQATLPKEKEAQQKESASFKAAMAQFQKTMAWRRIRYILTGLLIAALILALLTALNTIRKPLALDKFDISLKRTQDGQLLEVWDYHSTSYGGNSYTHGGTDKEGNYIVYLNHEVPLLQLGGYTNAAKHYQLSSFSLQDDGNLYESDLVFHYASGSWDSGTSTQIMEIRQGTEKDYKVLYRAGDTLPAAEQMELDAARRYLPYAPLTAENPAATPLPPADNAMPFAPKQETPVLTAAPAN